MPIAVRRRPLRVKRLWRCELRNSSQLSAFSFAAVNQLYADSILPCYIRKPLHAQDLQTSVWVFSGWNYGYKLLVLKGLNHPYRPKLRWGEGVGVFPCLNC